MTYYNQNNKKYKFCADNMKYIGMGECAKVYTDGNIIFKEYLKDTYVQFRLSSNMFNYLKNVDNPHFMKIYDIYSYMNYIDLIKNKFNLYEFIPDAYSAKYYENNCINILYESIDYILDNFNELEKLFVIFSNDGILVDDVKYGNVLLCNDYMVIIDPDKFCFTTYNISDLIIMNKKKLLYLFKSIGMHLLEENNLKDLSKKYNELCRFNIDESTNISLELEKRLNKSKIIDYLIK